MYNVSSGIVKGFDGINLYSESYHPKKEKDSQGVNFLVLHGFGSHLGRYTNLLNFFSEKSTTFYLYDHRGHGKSDGKRGHVNKFKDYARDARRLADRIKKEYPEKPLVMIGHSMGGLVLLGMLTETETEKKPFCDAAILSNPLLKLYMKVPLVKTLASGLLAKIAPSIQMKSEIPPEDLSHDPDVIKAYIDDSLVHSKVTPSWFVGMNRYSEKVRNSADIIPVPVLFIIGGSDRVVDSEETIRFTRALSSPRKTVRIYKDFLHEPFNEIGNEQVFKDMEKWIKEQGFSI